MKRVLSILLSLTMLCSLTAGLDFSAFADGLASSGSCGEEGNNVTWSFDSATGALTISGNWEMKDYSFMSPNQSPFYNQLSIKTIIINKGVTRIGDSAFEGCSSLTSISIPESVTSIGNNAFENCTCLTNVSGCNSVTYIGDQAFKDCTSLTNHTIPSGVTYIGDGAYQGCSSLTSVKIPNSVTEINGSSFAYCSGLKSVSIPKTVTKIHGCAFEGCTGLTNVNIPGSVTEIDDSSFLGCSGLTEITVDNNNTVYDSRNNCNAIIKTANNKLLYGCINTVIPEDVTEIGNSAFYNCSGLTSINIPNSVKAIGRSAFYNCTGLKSINIPNSVKTIGYYSFSNCSGLTDLTIGSGVIEIDEEAFYRCIGLLRISVNANNKYYDSRNNCNALIRTKDNALLCGNKNTVIPDSVITIANDAFAGQTALTSIQIPEGVKEIGTSAFSECKNLKNIQLPNNIVYIGTYAFKGTAYYNNTTNWQNGVLYIGKYLIDTKDSIVSNYKVKTGTKVIANSAFYDNSSLKGVTIPNTVTNIGYKAFRSCNHLTDVEMTNGLSTIGKQAFRYCEALESITIPSSVSRIGIEAFWKCSNLKTVVFGKGIKEIELCAFSFTGIDTVKYHGTFEEWGKININYDEYYWSGDRISNSELANATLILNYHQYGNSVTKSSLSKNGSIAEKCEECDNIKSEVTIYRPKTIKLAKTKYVYTGKAIKPAVTVKDAKGNTIAAKYYTVSYAKNKNVGTATATIKFKGNYSGTKKLTFVINPKATSISKLTAVSKGFTVKWKKQAKQTTGYQIQYSTSKTFKNAKTVTVKKNTTVSKKLTKLKAKKKYYVRIRTYKTVDGKKYYSAWSKAKTVTTKK